MFRDWIPPGALKSASKKVHCLVSCGATPLLHQAFKLSNGLHPLDSWNPIDPFKFILKNNERKKECGNWTLTLKSPTLHLT